jgi:hypothetical protein
MSDTQNKYIFDTMDKMSPEQIADLAVQLKGKKGDLGNNICNIINTQQYDLSEKNKDLYTINVNEFNNELMRQINNTPILPDPSL